MLRTNTAAGLVRKVKLSGFAAIAVTLLLPLVNLALAEIGLPALGPEDADFLYSLALGGVLGLGQLIQWFTAYKARPAAEDVPVDASGRAVVPNNLTVTRVAPDA